MGEPLIASVVLDTTVTGIEGFEWVTPPSYPGLWAQRVELPEQISPELVERDGARVHRYVVARHVLVPLKAGVVEIPAAEARVGIRARSVFAPLLMGLYTFAHRRQAVAASEHAHGVDADTRGDHHA